MSRTAAIAMASSVGRQGVRRKNRRSSTETIVRPPSHITMAALASTIASASTTVMSVRRFIGPTFWLVPRPGESTAVNAENRHV